MSDFLESFDFFTSDMIDWNCDSHNGIASSFMHSKRLNTIVPEQDEEDIAASKFERSTPCGGFYSIMLVIAVIVYGVKLWTDMPKMNLMNLANLLA